MYRPLVVPLVAFFLVSVPRFLGAQDSCHKQFVVSEVVLPTTTQLPASEQAAVRVRLIGRCFDNQQLGQLASEVRGVLESLGYLQAAVPEPSITVSDASRHPQPVSLDFEVKEGARYKVREIQLNGYRTLSSEQIMALSETQIEEFFDGTKMRQTAAAIRKLYAAKGYNSASVFPDVQFLGGLGVRVSFRIVEGQQSP